MVLIAFHEKQISGVEHFSLLVTCLSSLEKYLFSLLPKFYLEYGFSYWVYGVLYIFETIITCQTWSLQAYFPIMPAIFHPEDVFSVYNLISWMCSVFASLSVVLRSPKYSLPTQYPSHSLLLYLCCQMSLRYRTSRAHSLPITRLMWGC